MHVLVTGGAGFIGGHLCERLIRDGHTVTAIDNFDPFYPRAQKEDGLAAVRSHDRFTLIEDDVLHLDALSNRLDAESIDAIVHLAAKAGVRPSIADPLVYQRVNTVGTQSMLELGRRLDVRAFVLGSSSSIYGNSHATPFSESDRVEQPISPYAASKRAAELAAYTYHHLHGLTVHALRFFTVYGPRQRPDLAIHKFARMMLRGEPVPMFGDGSTSRDYTYVADIVDGIVRSLDRATSTPGAFDIINLGNSTPVPLRELIDLLGAALGVVPDVDQLPRQPGDVDHTYADISKARRLLGYDPQTPPAEGLQRFADWVRAYYEPTPPSGT